ncbi:histidine--tRNA ligase [Fulvivirgaceae bacterium LMO-SS25]
MQKPTLPKGTRDFGPEQMARRNFILDNIKSVFRKFGFMPLETPAMENLSVLTGKYGDEGDQLLFRILNSGDFMSKTDATDIAEGAKGLLPKITEKGLRYDLTVPFARYVVMNRNEVHFPFKRFQIQPVWRADRPQKGRYREFYQCDADIIGTDSIICEAEIILMIKEAYKLLGLEDYVITFSSRKVLEGLAGILNAKDKFTDLCVAIDKLDKIGTDKVLEELAGRGFETDTLDKTRQFLELKGNNKELIEQLHQLFANNEEGQNGLREVEEIISLLEAFGDDGTKIEFDPRLARGLSYYTGAIFEVKPTSVKMGTITAGGRYDNLTGIFGLDNMSGVGISFGVDRIYDVLEELNLFPSEGLTPTQVLLANFGDESLKGSLGILKSLRDAGIAAEIYPDGGKLKKQFTYAEKKAIPYLLMTGIEELQNGVFGLKDLKTGVQESLTLNQIIAKLG